MSTTREEILSAIELAAQVLPEADRAANHRESFITVLGLDPRLVGQGRGKRAAYILQAVVVALRKWDRKPDVAASREPDADQRAEPDDETRVDHEHGAEDGELRHETGEVHHVVR
jgi:hypothetical protein